jgi:crotonobetainyl-CoA:carnitine CoA-transferase CaiB-like acyl-CoA transferase
MPVADHDRNRRGPLADVRVLDLTRVLAGPFATLALVDLGAEVIKVEGPDAPDYTRSIPPFAGQVSHYFLSANRGKKSVSVDLKTEAGRDVALRLAMASDVVVENFRPGVLARLGLDYQTLSRSKPDVILCSLSGFGQDGSLSGKASVDTVVQALSGAMSVNGEAEGPPTKLGLPMGDLAGSMWAAVGILAALHGRDRTGRGSHVDVSLLDSLISQLSYLAELYLVSGESPAAVGSSHHTVPAYGRYAVRDGYLVLAAQMDGFWRRFCQAAGRSELAADPRFRSVADRRQHYAEVEALVSEIMLTRSQAEWQSLLDEADVPHAPVLSVGEALEQPYARERGLVRELEQPGSGTVRVVGPAMRFQGFREPVLEPAPWLGQHTREVLKGVLGMADAEVDGLLSQGAVSE